MQEVILTLSAVSVVLEVVILATLIVSRRGKSEAFKAVSEELRQTRRDINDDFSHLSDYITKAQENTAKLTELKLSGVEGSQKKLASDMENRLLQQESRFSVFSETTLRSLENVRVSVDKNLGEIRESNDRKLESMRQTVEEKLSKTVEERIGRSFKEVSERLEQVYRGLAEMQTLATGVGDLKKVLSNVKTRGILGEIQLESILSEILAPAQYVKNARVREGSADVVEFCVRLPGNGEAPVLLPVDAKFPTEDYERLCSAYDACDPQAVKTCQKSLEARILSCAKDIHDKYINPPVTTDFAVLFLPSEGLYAEAVRCGASDSAQRKYKISVVGPTTLAALLNSLQMGFRTLAIQQRTGEVWGILGAVKTEFSNFESVLSKTQQRLSQAGSELDQLVGVRTRAIVKKLSDVEKTLPEETALLIDD